MHTSQQARPAPLAAARSPLAITHAHPLAGRGPPPPHSPPPLPLPKPTKARERRHATPHQARLHARREAGEHGPKVGEEGRLLRGVSLDEGGQVAQRAQRSVRLEKGARGKRGHGRAGFGHRRQQAAQGCPQLHGHPVQIPLRQRPHMRLVICVCWGTVVPRAAARSVESHEFWRRKFTRVAKQGRGLGTVQAACGHPNPLKTSQVTSKIRPPSPPPARHPPKRLCPTGSSGRPAKASNTRAPREKASPAGASPGARLFNPVATSSGAV